MFQQPAPPPVYITAGTGITSIAAEPARAEYHDYLKSGIYTATFTDPTNKWRCYPTVAGYGEYQILTLVCVQAHEVKEEQLKAK